ncbi:MAG: prolyl oligopeptidase family serine peptidase [Paraglaciecola sp.]|nr:prolyl oligopeptidase family serine peptidase [Paraglaciecola sp.]
MKNYLNLQLKRYTILVMVLICPSAFAQSSVDTIIKSSGSLLVKQSKFISPFANYEAFIEFMKASPSATPPWSDSALKKSFSKSLYETCTDSTQIEFQEIIYQSPNGYTRGWTIRPRTTEHPLPVVVFNRGGFSKWGRIVPFELLSLCQVATNGYMIVASDFRGKQGTDLVGKQDKTDLGYGDVKDNFYLLEAVKKKYSDIDTDNIAVWGFSRGTTLAALMATQTDTIRLVILQGMVSDLVNNSRRDEFDEHVYPLLFNDYSKMPKFKQDALLAGISPIRLMDKIKGRPNFLILHGSKDQRTSANNALLYATELLKRNFNVEVHLYSESGHVLSGSFDMYINEVISALNENFSNANNRISQKNKS